MDCEKNAVKVFRTWGREKNFSSGELNEASPKKLAFSFSVALTRATPITLSDNPVACQPDFCSLYVQNSACNF